MADPFENTLEMLVPSLMRRVLTAQAALPSLRRTAGKVSGE